MAAALLALALLSYASIRSVVMQTEMAISIAAQPLSSAAPAASAAAPDPMAGMDMSGMSMVQASPPPGSALTPSVGSAPHKPNPGQNPGASPGAACPYCSVAGHVPILAAVTIFRASSGFVFAAFRVVASHGPRGPPSPQPRARGPPADLLTL